MSDPLSLNSDQATFENTALRNLDEALEEFRSLVSRMTGDEVGGAGEVATRSQDYRGELLAIQKKLDEARDHLPAVGLHERYGLLAGITLHPEFAAIHDHDGGSLKLETLRVLGIIHKKEDLGADFPDFVASFGLTPENTSGLNSYTGDNKETGRRSVYDRSEYLQSGAAPFKDAVDLVLDCIYSFGGSIPFRAPDSDNDVGYKREMTKAKYIELKSNPMKRTGKHIHEGVFEGGAHLEQIFLEMHAGLDNAELRIQRKSPEFRAGHVICFGKDLTFEQNMILAEKTAKYTEKFHRIIGLDMAGPEFDPTRTKIVLSTHEGRRQLKEIFDRAGRDLPITLHLGETTATDLETFEKTLMMVHPKRVSHPLTAVLEYLQNGDRRGMEVMKDLGIVVEFLPRSNEVTRRVSGINEFKAIIQACKEFGIPVTIGTDASGFQGMSFAQELANLLLCGAATLEDVNNFILVGLESCFLNHKRSLAR